MQLKQKVTSLIKKIIKLPIWITIPATFALLVFSICFISFFIEKPVQFSYSKETCVKYPTLFPTLNKLSDSNYGFDITNKDIVKIGDFYILSMKTCFSAKKAPTVGNAKLSVSPFGGWIAKNTFRLSIPQPPMVKVGALDKPIPTAKPLVVELSGSDLVFSYKLEVENKSADCPIDVSAIHCDIASLHLTQDKSYDIKLNRLFGNQKVATILSKSIKTLNSTNITSSSVGADQVVYDNPKSFTFDFSKDVIKTNIILEKVGSGGKIPVRTTVTIKDKRATVSILDNLDRDAIYRFTVDQLEAIDGSTLPDVYILNFKMSDGPSVASVNVGSYGLSTSQTIILTFDQALADNTDITKFVSTSGIPTSISRLNNQVYIKYANASMCTNLSINVKAGLVSSIGILQSDGWSFSTRTVCHSTSTIGYSKDGRPIVAYVFGSGGTTILYTGAIHGNELSSKYLMDAWVGELELNARSIPADKKIVVIPSLNPDGVAANRRNNSNNVDLNRNFATFDWQTDVTTPANQPLPGGGGSSPLSEPESQAIASYTIQLKPRLTMSFHSSASYAIANQAGDSVNLVAEYARLSGYRNMTGNDGAFSYPITGTYDDWMRDKYGLTSVLIELSSSTNSEFSRNKAALWAMAKI